MENSLATVLTWVGIIFCISQSAMFSGLNLALFSISLLRLEVEASIGNKNAEKLLRLREDSNFILTTAFNAVWPFAINFIHIFAAVLGPSKFCGSEPAPPWVKIAR